MARRHEQGFLDMGVLSTAQISRMKHIELICELALSIHLGDVLNKKSALNQIMQKNDFDMRELNKAFRRCGAAINRISRMFPKLYTTRFAQVTDFYTLVVLIAKFEEEGLILTDRKRNRLAWDLLSTFSTKIDEMRVKQKRAENIEAGQEIFRQYLLTVTQNTDEVHQRRTRQQILEGILRNLFLRKDDQRLFSQEQRRILWNTSEDRKCARCHKLVTWDDLTIDHVDPHSRGGKTGLKNAALMHRACNSAKGNRR